ncbi:MAG TPA: TPM domain-containing protein [Thermoanaerobaculia bacterium]|nr:TPM domain-containing protein [Thermoanaerobaculia bacterium]
MRSSSIRALCLVAALAAPARGQEYAPYPQPDAGYVTDLAGVLSRDQQERIEQWLLQVELKSRTEIVVVTIDSISDYPGTRNATLESFATALFNRWGVGNKPQNDGVLLLVAVKDRRARIELGAGYAGARDHDAAAIMQNVILPRFRQNDYAGGITRGVKAIVNEFSTVRIGFPWTLVVVPAVIVILLLAGISLIRNGKRGWGWVLVGLALVLVLVLIYLLIMMMRARTRSSGWLSGGAGGFGGGFSSGGGASGSW